MLKEEVRALVMEQVAQHERWRQRTINLIASENMLSPAVRGALQSDLVQRYGDYTGRDLAARRYRGNQYIEQIERLTVELASQAFGAKYVELRPVSGHIAGAAVIMGLCRSGDVVLEPGRDAGGHREAGKFAISPLLLLEVHSLPFDAHRYNIDLEAAERQIRKHRPRMVILGSSNFLFPHPVREVRRIINRVSPGTYLVYDASHVMGFLASGAFQKPLEEGADLVFGSTHKTLPGPQGGILFSNREDVMDSICEATYPGLVTNHHLFRLPALALALLEMQEWGQAYTRQIVANAQAFGEALKREGIECVNVDGQYSASHTVLMCVKQFGKAAEVAARLEACGIITTTAFLPEAWGGEGIRIGVQEVTRMGATEGHMRQIAALIARAMHRETSADEVEQASTAFALSLGPASFTWAS